jgi:hypothetical protein
MKSMNYLFTGPSMFDVVENEKQRVKKEVQKLDANYILNASEQDLIRALVDEFYLHVPKLREDDIHVADYRETQIDVSGDPNRFIIHRGEPFYIQGNKTTIVVPFDGDPGFFKIRPQTFTLNPPAAEVVGNDLQLVYITTNQSAGAVKRDYQNDLGQIRRHLDSLRASAEEFNKQLESLVRQSVVERKKRLLADAGMVAALGLPIKKRADAPMTYTVPIQRHGARVDRPTVPTRKFEPEPILATEEYENILSIMKNMVRVMEQSPHAFDEMKEEDLRTHFLVQLNAQYEGQATGETFNFQGKTDILIRTEGRNVFVAECKFWKGEKELHNAIDQLLSYLSWRDTKTALLVFNRNAGFSEVLKKIESAVPMHKNFKRNVGKSDESTFRYVFGQPNDSNRELSLTVLAFDVPRKTSLAAQRPAPKV